MLVIVAPTAARNIASARAYHAEHGYQAAFESAVFARISDHPLMFPIAYRDVRRALLRRFPYSTFFVLDGEQAVILAVQHQRRDPAARPKR